MTATIRAMNTALRSSALSCVAAAACVFLGAAPPDAPEGGGGAVTGRQRPQADSEAKYYERLDKEDREALQAIVGWMLPKPPEAMSWVGGEGMSRPDFLGKVTVIQSVGGKQSPRAALEKVKKSLPEGVLLIGLHTPDQSERAAELLSTNPPCPVAVDARGEWCDALGIWKKPVNIVVDKSGAVRYAGLSEAGLKAKLTELLAEETDESVSPRERPAPAGEPETAEPAKWPEFIAPVGPAEDKRGKAIPGFSVAKWLTTRPDPGTRLVALDFWATWCPPCRAAIPHVNELQEKYGQDILFVGVSDEKEADFNAGMKKTKLKPADFRYSLALDPAAKLMKGFFKVRGIPHMAIFSPDGVVRWQGNPMQLQDEDIAKLVAANRASSKAAGAKGGRGWAASGAGQKSR